MSEKNKKTRTISAHIIKADSSGQNTMSRLYSNEVRDGGTKGGSSLYSNAVRDGDIFIAQSVDMRGLRELVKHSSILPQCIRAYKYNIAGFGIGIRYKSGKDDADAPDKEAEWAKMQEIIELLNMDADTKEVFEDVIEAREIYGIAYLEVMRNLAGEVDGIDFIKNIPSIQKTAPLAPAVEVEYLYKDKIVKRPKKFCKYKQEIDNKIVYFKEIGDTRAMDKYTGEYGESIAIENEASEILEFAIGTETYGEVRWIGQVLGIDGSRKAENLNNRYFDEGRHTPLLIVVKGGTLTDDSFNKLKEYMNDIKGENGQHAFMVLETDSDKGTNMGEIEKAPDIEIHNLAGMLQQDELFQTYLDNNRKRVQSAFQLPDLYVGYTEDYNRATSQTAQEVTEKQIFQPERQSLAWVVNNKLLADYKFKYVEAYFKEPDIQNPDDIVKILNVTERAGGLTPNRAKELTYKISGGISEDYKDKDGKISEWGNIPLAYAKMIQQTAPTLDTQLAKQIKKADDDGHIEIVAVMKAVRAMLSKREAENHE